MIIKILFEDKNILAIDKPAGIMVHPDGKNNTKKDTISDWVLSNYPSIKNVGEPIIVEKKDGKVEKLLRPGIVHRLDKETSGVLLIAKNKKTFLFLNQILFLIFISCLNSINAFIFLIIYHIRLKLNFLKQIAYILCLNVARISLKVIKIIRLSGDTRVESIARF